MTGRRERKKAETRVRIQHAALDLFERDGFSRTTVEQISDLADVSTTTFFRYFPTKDDTVGHNPFTPGFLARFADQPADLAPLDAVRAAIRDAATEFDDERWAHERRRQRFVLREPDLRGPSIAALSELAAEFGRLVAERTGRSVEAPEVRTFVGAVLGVFGAVATGELTAATYVDTLDAALTHLAAGVPLVPDRNGPPSRTPTTPTRV